MVAQPCVMKIIIMMMMTAMIRHAALQVSMVILRVVHSRSAVVRWRRFSYGGVSDFPRARSSEIAGIGLELQGSILRWKRKTQMRRSVYIYEKKIKTHVITRVTHYCRYLVIFKTFFFFLFGFSCTDRDDDYNYWHNGIHKTGGMLICTKTY